MLPQVDSTLVLRLQAEAKGWKPVTLDQISGKESPCRDGDTGEFARSTLVSLKVSPAGAARRTAGGKRGLIYSTALLSGEGFGVGPP